MSGTKMSEKSLNLEEGYHTAKSSLSTADNSDVEETQNNAAEVKDLTDKVKNMSIPSQEGEELGQKKGQPQQDLGKELESQVGSHEKTGLGESCKDVDDSQAQEPAPVEKEDVVEKTGEDGDLEEAKDNREDDTEDVDDNKENVVHVANVNAHQIEKSDNSDENTETEKKTDGSAKGTAGAEVADVESEPQTEGDLKTTQNSDISAKENIATATIDNEETAATTGGEDEPSVEKSAGYDTKDSDVAGATSAVSSEVSEGLSVTIDEKLADPSLKAAENEDKSEEPTEKTEVDAPTVHAQSLSETVDAVESSEESDCKPGHDKESSMDKGIDSQPTNEDNNTTLASTSSGVNETIDSNKENEDSTLTDVSVENKGGRVESDKADGVVEPTTEANKEGDAAIETGVENNTVGVEKEVQDVKPKEGKADMESEDEPKGVTEEEVSEHMEEPKKADSKADETEAKKDLGVESKKISKVPDAVTEESLEETESNDLKEEPKTESKEDAAVGSKEDANDETKELATDESKGGANNGPKEDSKVETEAESTVQSKDESKGGLEDKPEVETKDEPAVESTDVPVAESKDVSEAKSKDEPEAESKDDSKDESEEVPANVSSEDGKEQPKLADSKDETEETSAKTESKVDSKDLKEGSSKAPLEPTKETNTSTTASETKPSQDKEDGSDEDSEESDSDDDDQLPIYIYTSLASPIRGMTSRTRKLATLLDVWEIEYTVVDLGTTERAKRIWKLRGKGRQLPAVIRDDEVVGNFEEIMQLEEDGEDLQEVICEDEIM